jgi:hypothetical protein
MRIHLVYGLLVLSVGLSLTNCRSISPTTEGVAPESGMAVEPAGLPPSSGAEQATSAPKAEEEPLTTEAVAQAIEAYVERDTRLKGGYFLVYDPKVQQPLALRLTKVHRDRLSHIGEGVYFVCADFETPDGVVYDLDFFTKATPSGLEVTEVTIHKEEGRPRYTWYKDEADGLWKRRPVEE